MKNKKGLIPETLEMTIMLFSMLCIGIIAVIGIFKLFEYITPYIKTMDIYQTLIAIVLLIMIIYGELKIYDWLIDKKKERGR